LLPKPDKPHAVAFLGENRVGLLRVVRGALGAVVSREAFAPVFNRHGLILDFFLGLFFYLFLYFFVRVRLGHPEDDSEAGNFRLLAFRSKPSSASSFDHLL
tara:strand:- start:419 stop:721 length:303 start_codon:yes stop_codon:yes gene_type:complete